MNKIMKIKILVTAVSSLMLSSGAWAHDNHVYVSSTEGCQVLNSSGVLAMLEGPDLNVARTMEADDTGKIKASCHSKSALLVGEDMESAIKFNYENSDYKPCGIKIGSDIY